MDKDLLTKSAVRRHSELEKTEYDSDEDTYRLVYRVPEERLLEGRGFIDTMDEYVPLEEELVLEFSDPREAVDFHVNEFLNGYHREENPETAEIDLLVSTIHEISRQKHARDLEEDFFSIGGPQHDHEHRHIRDEITGERTYLIDLADGTNPSHTMITEELLDDIIERYAERLSKKFIAENITPEDSGIEVNYKPSAEFYDLSLDSEQIPDQEDRWNR